MLESHRPSALVDVRHEPLFRLVDAMVGPTLALALEMELLMKLEMELLMKLEIEP